MLNGNNKECMMTMFVQIFFGLHIYLTGIASCKMVIDYTIIHFCQMLKVHIINYIDLKLKLYC